MLPEYQAIYDTPINATLPLSERINMPLLRAALNVPVIYMNHWDTDANVVKFKYPNEKIDTYENCGTVGCIAGSVCLIAKSRGAYSIHARELLRLDYDEADSLFMPEENNKAWGLHTGDKPLLRAHVNAWLEENGVSERV